MRNEKNSKSKEEYLEELRKKNGDYWKDRFQQLEDETYCKTEEFYKDLQKQFEKAQFALQENIKKWYWRLANNNEISYAEAKKFLQKNALKEFHWTVEEYIQYGKENAINQKWIKQLENASAKVHISYLEAMKIQVQQQAEKMFSEYESRTSKFLKNTYVDNFYHTAYEVAKGTGIGTNLARIDEKAIEVILKKPWAQDGNNFSSRIWQNKEKLVNVLHTELAQNIIRGEFPDKAAKKVAEKMQTSMKQARTLVYTESAAISSIARGQCLDELGVEKYEIVATLDSITSELCREMDGKVFDRKEYQVGLTAPPFHPNCRSTTVPYFDDEFTIGEERIARSQETGKTYYVPANMKYSEWKEIFVDKSKSQETSMNYLIRNHKNAMNTEDERKIVLEAISSVPPKVQKALQEGTIIDIGKIGASQYDYKNDILYVAKGASKEAVVHEIGHMVENKLLDIKKVEKLKKEFLRNIPIGSIVQEIFYDASGNPREIFILKHSEFVSEYQGRLYVNDWSEIYDENWNVRAENLQKFISEPFREYIENPERMKNEFLEFYELIREAVE